MLEYGTICVDKQLSLCVGGADHWFGRNPSGRRHQGVQRKRTLLVTSSEREGSLNCSKHIWTYDSLANMPALGPVNFRPPPTMSKQKLRSSGVARPI
jgi:hypothetical protein